MGTAMFVKAMMKQFSDPDESHLELDAVVVALSWGLCWLFRTYKKPNTSGCKPMN
jgi:hypothetical protein